jgi:hypothetical protein
MATTDSGTRLQLLRSDAGLDSFHAESWEPWACGRRAAPAYRPGAGVAPARYRHPAAPARPGPPAALVGLATPLDAGTPTPRHHHDHNKLQLPYLTTPDSRVTVVGWPT